MNGAKVVQQDLRPVGAGWHLPPIPKPVSLGWPACQSAHASHPRPRPAAGLPAPKYGRPVPASDARPASQSSWRAPLAEMPKICSAVIPSSTRRTYHSSARPSPSHEQISTVHACCVSGRAERIRTSELHNPIVARYQAALPPEVRGSIPCWMERSPSNNAATVGGIVLVGLGVLFLAQQAIGFDLGHYGWPIFVLFPGWPCWRLCARAAWRGRAGGAGLCGDDHRADPGRPEHVQLVGDLGVCLELIVAAVGLGLTLQGERCRSAAGGTHGIRHVRGRPAGVRRLRGRSSS